MKRFPFFCAVEAESLHRYCFGGYHPVRLGDTFKSDRYKVIHKLGFGSYSTVWLAKDQSHQKYVALKISTSDVKVNQELQILRHLSHISANDSGSRNIVKLLDDFHHSGPNGTHNCLVLELLGPNLPSILERSWMASDGRFPGKTAKQITREVLLGVDFLHRHNIGHGDLHFGNIATCIEPVDDLLENELIQRLGVPKTDEVTHVDGLPLDQSMPEYLVWPVSMSKKLGVREGEFKIVDFGQSFESEKPPSTLHTPRWLRAPEVIFGDNFDKNVDLWSLGCLIFDLFSGEPPFDIVMIDKHLPIVIEQMIESIGPLPPRWHDKWEGMQNGRNCESTSLKFTAPGATVNDLQEWLDEVYFEDEYRTADLGREDIMKVGSTVKNLLRYAPSERVTPAEILRDEWWQ